MSDVVDELRGDFDLTRPTVGGSPGGQPPANAGSRPAGGAAAKRRSDIVIGHLTELGQILSDIEQLKLRASSIPDWQAVMMHVSGIKFRVTEMRADVKAAYVTEFGEHYDNELRDGTEGQSKGRGTSNKTAEIRAKANSELFLRADARFEQTTKDLEGLLWTIKSTIERLESDRDIKHFDVLPDHLFSGITTGLKAVKNQVVGTKAACRACGQLHTLYLPTGQTVEQTPCPSCNGALVEQQP